VYARVHYPDYMCGPSYLMAKNTVKSLLDTLEEYFGPVFYIEDVLNRNFRINNWKDDSR
jgi:hypothetical protein